MIIGDPYKFAIMFDEVREWSTCDRLSGHFAFCMNGKMLPEGIINAILDNALAKVYDKLKNAPEDAELFTMDAAAAFGCIYDRVYPSDINRDNDYRFELAPEEVIDEGYIVFVIRKAGEIRVLAANPKYDREQSRCIFDRLEVTEAVLDEEQYEEMISRMEEHLRKICCRYRNAVMDHLNENTVRIVKIDEEALFEFIYETFNDKHDDIMNLDAVECMNWFEIDWENHAFLYAAKKFEDENENILPFPKDIDFKKILKTIPATTTTVLTGEKVYRDYTFDELRKL